MNPMQIMAMLQNSGNPMQMLTQMAQQNPMMNRAMQMGQVGRPRPRFADC